MKQFESGARSSEEAPRYDLHGLPFYKHARLIGFGHKARQGKDLAVKLLAATFPGRVARVAFADALRVVCRVQHGMTTKDAPLLQRVGVEARQSDPLIWIRAAAWAIAELDAEAEAPFFVCLPDTRFQNEAAFVRARGVTCRLIRLTPDGQRYIATDRPANHPSEVDLDDYDWQHSITAATRGELQAGVIDVASRLIPEVAPPRSHAHANTPEDEYRQDTPVRLAHDERILHLQPCPYGRDRECYPPGQCRKCVADALDDCA